MDVKIYIATEEHYKYAQTICDAIEEAAKLRGTGIAKRSSDYIIQKMQEDKAIIALDGLKFAGFCYIEVWGDKGYAANSGLIVMPEYRKSGLAKQIKKASFDHSRVKYPEAKMFGITTSLAVMKINTDLGYKPVTFSELTTDESFWNGCKSCPNFDILTRTKRKHCLCTGMLFDPAKDKEEGKKFNFDNKSKLYERWLQFKRFIYKRRRVKQD